MANVLFCSDLHLGHKGIERFRKHVSSEEDNTYQLVRDWKYKVTKRDIVYVLGDAAFTMESVKIFEDLPGIKYLIRGNHDELNTSVYLKYFKEVYGLLKYKEFWLSHSPIHVDELRNRVNLHGHVHYSSIRVKNDLFKLFGDNYKLDKRYLNCCPENLLPLVGNHLISLDEVRTYLKQP